MQMDDSVAWQPRWLFTLSQTCITPLAAVMSLPTSAFSRVPAGHGPGVAAGGAAPGLGK